MARKYELRKRADAMQDTRRRITEAAIELHGSLGPARTTVTAVAQRAGVQRHTVYRHYPTDADLFAACSAHFGAQHPWPDPAAWAEIPDPRQRLAAGLDAIYAYYEQTEHMWTAVLRDRDLVEAIGPAIEPFEAWLAQAARALGAGRPVEAGRRAVLDAALRHAVDFVAWRSLVHETGITREQGADLMTALVERAAS